MWIAPLKNMPLIPVDGHPGAFGTVRKHDIHTGVDLYCEDKAEVFAVEDGIVVFISPFTGDQAGSPWWNNTQAIGVLGASGVVVYGEVTSLVAVGDKVSGGQSIASVDQVLKKDKGRPVSMLHIELYNKIMEPVWWHHENSQPEGLLDPTDFLKKI